ncbi:MAG TPA: hypothetical protein VM076_18490 [Gemmatimonadaceae bacterium]|nr:hypothetical protein [Gemmatimonadaceae bacterium]
MVRTRSSLLLATVSVLPLAMFAQVPNRPAESQEPVPRELVLALLNLGPGMGGGADIRVGKAPDDTPPELIPPGVEILGSTFQFENMVLVLAAKQQPDSAISSIEAKLLAAGWTKPPTPASRAARGFVPADYGMVNYSPPDMLCQGNAFVTMAGTYRRTGGSIIKLSYNRGQQYSACKARTDVAVARSSNPYDDAPIPLLRAPQGSIVGTDVQSMGMSSNTITISTHLKTRLKVGEVSAHYDKQMREQGWTPISDGAVEIVAGRNYRKTDEKSRTWTAVLISMSSADAGEQDALMRLTSKP